MHAAVAGCFHLIRNIKTCDRMIFQSAHFAVTITFLNLNMKSHIICQIIETKSRLFNDTLLEIK